MTTKELKDDIVHQLEAYRLRCFKEALDTSNVTRVEVIDSDGRSYVNWDKDNKVRLDFQDDGRTLKIFISNKNNG